MTVQFNIRLEGKEIKQSDGFVYLGGMATEDGNLGETRGSKCTYEDRAIHDRHQYIKTIKRTIEGRL